MKLKARCCVPGAMSVEITCTLFLKHALNNTIQTQIQESMSFRFRSQVSDNNTNYALNLNGALLSLCFSLFPERGKSFR